ncbi:MAG: hypothetical protein ABIH18_05280 [Candidatus Omnitrophota bacterium]
MEQIRFDFNNVFASAIGKTHGITDAELSVIKKDCANAHKHLSAVLKNSLNRVNLGLEWAALPFQSDETIQVINSLAKEIKKYDNVISLGIGGSYLGLKAAQDALSPWYYNEFDKSRKGLPRVYFEGNNLDPDTLSALLKNLNPKKTFVVVISKSGETTETKAGFMIVEAWLKKAVGKHYGRQVVVITDPLSGSLRKKANDMRKNDRLSFRGLNLLKGVGGRFSELNMGLLHLAIIGIDIRQVLNGAKLMAERCACPDLFKNPAYMYAAAHTILYKNKKKPIAILMPFSELLKSTADWYVQLLAESLGKKYSRVISVNQQGLESWQRGQVVNTGRTPVSCRGTNDLHSIQQNNIEGENDKVITFIRIEKFQNDIKITEKSDLLSGRRFSELLKLAQEATEWALVRESRPNCTIIMPRITPFYWGQLLFFFEMAVAFEGELLKVNAFDQPGVEGYKNYMYYKLRKPGISEAIAKEIKDNPLIKKDKLIL